MVGTNPLWFFALAEDRSQTQTNVPWKTGLAVVLLAAWVLLPGLIFWPLLFFIAIFGAAVGVMIWRENRPARPENPRYRIVREWTVNIVLIVGVVGAMILVCRAG